MVLQDKKGTSYASEGFHLGQLGAKDTADWHMTPSACSLNVYQEETSTTPLQHQNERAAQLSHLTGQFYLQETPLNFDRNNVVRFYSKESDTASWLG